jgi:hypothetical protein
MNMAHVTNKVLRPQLTKLWDKEVPAMRTKEVTVQVGLAGCIIKSAKLTQTWGQGTAKRKQKEEFELPRLDLQEDPQNPLLHANLAECAKRLTTIDKDRAEWVSNTIQPRWLIRGDRSTKFFLGQHKFKAKSKETFIHHICNLSGQVVTEWERIAGAGV